MNKDSDPAGIICRVWGKPCSHPELCKDKCWDDDLIRERGYIDMEEPLTKKIEGIKLNSFELDQLYYQLEKDWTINLTGIFKSYYLPVGVLVAEPRIVTGQEIRAYNTGMYLDDLDKIIGHQDLAMQAGFEGFGGYSRVYMVEVWEDEGQDGHIHYTLRGWRFVSSERLGELRAQIYTGCELPPPCMMMEDRDYE